MKLPLLLTLLVIVGGCRAIGRFGESRQSIAARRLSRQGVQAMRQGDWQHAEKCFTGALEVAGTDDAAHRGMAKTLWHRGQLDEAIEHMEAASQLTAGDPRSMLQLGEMYLAAGRADEARQQCRDAIAADRTAAAAWGLWGDCEMHSGRSAEAMAAYHHSLAIQPDYPRVQWQLSEIYLKEGRFDRLLATLDGVRGGGETPEMAMSTGEPGQQLPAGRLSMLRGLAYQNLQRPGDAIEAFQLAARLNPTDPAPRVQLAALAMGSGETELASRYLSEASQIGAVAARPGNDALR